MGGRAALLIAPVAAVLALACCQIVSADSPALPQFALQPNGIELPPRVPGKYRAPTNLVLVPAGDCVFGFDTGEPPITSNEQLNEAPASWVGAPGCTRLVLSPRSPAVRDPQPSGALRMHAAVPAGDGGVLGLGSYPLPGAGANIGQRRVLFRREPDGSIRELVRLPVHWFHHPNPDSPNPVPGTFAWELVRTGQRIYMSGADVVDSRIVPVVWTSTDTGATLTALRLPPAPTDPALNGSGQSRTPVPAAIATDGRTLLATESSSDQNGRLWTWRSADGGQTWQVSAASWTPSTAAPVFSVAAVTRAHGRWLLFGSAGAESAVLSSRDGSRWTIEDDTGRGLGWIGGASVDHRGDLVVLSQFGGAWRGEGKTRRADVCGVVWSGRLGALSRQDLGCFHPQAGAAQFSSIATIADGRVLITNGTELWIRR